ncbi:MAG: glycosyltransferase family 4 protein [Anaerolineae bacterium]
MRILHVAHQYPPNRRGGVEVYTQALARRQAAQGHTVGVVHGWADAVNAPPLVPQMDEAGVTVWAAQAHAPRHPLDLFLRSFDNRPMERAFADLLADFRPDVVHVQHLKGLSARLIGVARSAGVPVLWTLHDWWAFCGNAQLVRHTGALCGGPVLWLNCADCAAHHGGVTRSAAQEALALAGMPAVAGLFAYRARLLDAALAETDVLIAPTAFVRDRFAQQGLDTGRFVVVEHGIHYPAWVTELPRADSPGGRLRVGYTGALAWQKGVDVLVAAFNRLPADAAELRVYGDPRPFPDYARRLTAMAQHPRIQFRGPYAPAERWAILRDLDVVVVPSVWPETSSLVAQEAFAARRPVIASRVGALRDRVQDGVNGYLVPPGDVDALADVLARLAADPALLARLQAGVTPPRSLDDHAREVEKLYMAASPRRPAVIFRVRG